VAVGRTYRDIVYTAAPSTTTRSALLTTNYQHKYYAEVGPQGMARKPIGTGPYMVESLEPGKSIVFVKNTKYWDGSPKGKPSIGKVVTLHPGEDYADRDAAGWRARP
jgi:ABC-type oligopeptide transport system substrate-binding subunit